MPEVTNVLRIPCRLFRKAVQQGRSERRGESYSGPYGEPLNEARTQLADFVNSLLGIYHRNMCSLKTERRRDNLGAVVTLIAHE